MSNIVSSLFVPGLQQRVKAARESSVETRHRALALLATIIQKHLAGTPAGQYSVVSPGTRSILPFLLVAMEPLPF